MEKIINFDSIFDFNYFLQEKKCSNVIGIGSEGICLLSKEDKHLYKKIDNDALKEIGLNYDAKKIITTDDIDLSKFILPQELYILKEQLLGYKTKYIKPKDLFNLENLELLIKERLFNEENFLKAYDKIEKEVFLLSKEKIKIYDLNYNLIFTGKQLYGIDTCGYERVNESIEDYNYQQLHDSIKDIFYTALSQYTLLPDKYLKELDEEKNMVKYTKKLTKLINN